MTVVLEHTYRPRGACVDLFNYRGPEVLMSGPGGTGKSRGCLEKLLVLALKNPGMKALIVRKTQKSMASTILTEFGLVLAETLAAGYVRYFGGSSREPAAYRFKNGSTILIGGMDTPAKIMSSQYDVIYVNEAFELIENDWEMCTTRLRNGKLSFQQIMADTNPQQPTHWLKQRCERGQTKMLLAQHTDNPAYVNDDGTFTPLGDFYINEVLEKLTGVRRSRMYEGKWVAADGAIWGEWDETIHLIDRKDLPNGRIPWDWQRVWSIDFGHTVPMVVQRWALDGDGRMYLYGEMYATKRLVEDVAEEHRKLVTPDASGKAREPRPAWIVADHDAGERASWERHFGQSTMPAKKNVIEGLQSVSSRLRPAADGRPRLMILRDARTVRDQALSDTKRPTCTADEIPGYVWADNATKEQPRKEDDHGCDALRYAVAELDVGGRPRLRFL